MINSRKLLVSILNKIYGCDIYCKPIYQLNKVLFFERSQHLMFLKQKHIRYEFDIQNKLRKIIKEGDVVFDIGANIGQYSLFFSELIGENGKLYSIEPDYNNFTFLQFNKRKNNCSNMICLNVGLGANKDKLTFYSDSISGGRTGSFIKEYVGKNWKGIRNEIQIITLDNLINDFGEPDFVKIDVEGFEIKVLEGLTHILNKTNFLIEVRSETKDAVFNFFNDKNYECICVDNIKEFYCFEKNQIPDFANLVFKPRY